MDGTTIKPTEGYIRTVADLNWQVAGVGDFNGDGTGDVLWRNVATGENYLYPMNGTTILGTEGYLRTVADLAWRVKGAGDYDGDGKADVLWRNAANGDNYLYFMDGTTIKPTEGYIRNVADQNWRPRRIEGVAHRRANLDGAQVPTASAATGSGTIAMNLLTREVQGAIVTSGLASISDAHIHLGATGVNGDVIVPFAALNATTWVAPPGATMPAANYLDFLNGNTYFNVHTPSFPSGEIRGQLQ
jgi:hypothetical protein